MTLTLSAEAATLVRSLTHEAAASAGSGLRIAVDARHDSLTMALAEGHSPGDSVVRRHDALVFVSPQASHRLTGLTLRAGSSPERASFFLAESAARQPGLRRWLPPWQ